MNPELKTDAYPSEQVARIVSAPGETGSAFRRSSRNTTVRACGPGTNSPSAVSVCVGSARRSDQRAYLVSPAGTPASLPVRARAKGELLSGGSSIARPSRAAARAHSAARTGRSLIRMGLAETVPAASTVLLRGARRPLYGP